MKKEWIREINLVAAQEKRNVGRVFNERTISHIKRGTVNLYFTRLPCPISHRQWRKLVTAKPICRTSSTSFLFLFLHIAKVIASSLNIFDRIGKLFIYEFHYFTMTDISREGILNSLCSIFLLDHKIGIFAATDYC